MLIKKIKIREVLLMLLFSANIFAQGYEHNNHSGRNQ